MASGRDCLILTEDVDWHAFALFAERLIAETGARLVSKGDGADFRLWKVLLHGSELLLVYQDFPQEVSLEPTSDLGEGVVRRLFDDLQSGDVRMA